MFDARIILGGQPADPIGSARSFAELMRTNQAMSLDQAREQRTLADLMKKQQHERGLRDLLTKAGPSSQQRLVALASNPDFIKEQMALETHQADVGRKKAGADKAEADLARQTQEHLVALLHGTTDQADFERRVATQPPEVQEQLRGRLWEQIQPSIEALANSPDMKVKLATAELKSAMAGKIRGGLAPPSATQTETDAAKLEAIRLKNEEKRRNLAGGGSPPPPKDSDVRAWSNKVPEGTRNIFSEVGKAKAIADSVGGIENLAGVGLVGGKAPPQLLPKNEQEFRQHSAAAANAYRKIFAGAAVSPEEGAQINKAIAMVESGKTANEVATGLLILEGFADDGLEQALAGADQAIKDKIFRDIKPARKQKAGDGAKAVPASWSDDDEAKLKELERKEAERKARGGK